MNTIKYLTDEELLRFKKVKKSPMYDLGFDLCLTYALRVAELVDLRLEDFDFANAEIFVQGMKGGRKKHHPMNGAIAKKYQKWLKVRDQMEQAKGNPYLFSSKRNWYESVSRDSFQKEFRTICEKANISGHSIHDLRHTCAIRLIKAGQSLIFVRDWLRQRNLSSTEIYLRYIDDKKEAKKNLEIVSGLL